MFRLDVAGGEAERSRFAPEKTGSDVVGLKNCWVNRYGRPLG